MAGQYTIPANLDNEIEGLEVLIEKFKRKEITATELKVNRVPFGVYEQREPDTYMVRVRCAAGFITPQQLAGVAKIAQEFAKSDIHITSRQEVQIHYVKIEDLVTVIRRLKAIGLSPRGGGGNTVRNITAQEDAGVDPNEIFDVSPHAVELTNRFIAEGESWNLPRKFKIGFSGSEQDKGLATVSCLGFIAKIKDNKRGFRVYAAGGLGAKSTVANLLIDFIEEDQVYVVARAVRNLFSKYGNRKNKHAARLRFLWLTLGEEEFRKKFAEELAIVQQESLAPFIVKETSAPLKVNFGSSDYQNLPKEAFDLWKKRYASPQKQAGYFTILIPIELGFLPNIKAIALAEFLEKFGNNVIRMTRDQNFVLRNIPENQLERAYVFLRENLLLIDDAPIYGRFLSCAGASTCQMGICLSRGAARGILKELRKSDLDLDKLGEFRLNISGCPNSCGQHPIADLGFSGKALRNDGHSYPSYMVYAGAVIKEGKTKLAERFGDVPARNLPVLVRDLVKSFLTNAGQEKDFRSYMGGTGVEVLKSLVEKYKNPASFDEDKNFYFDWEADNLFNLLERRGGECSAGLYDLIGVDLNNIRETRAKITETVGEEKRKKLNDLLLFSARTLLITRAVEAKNEQEIFAEFRKHFILTDLVDKFFDDLLIKAGLFNFDPIERESEIIALSQAVEKLYESMDNTFNFNKSIEAKAAPAVNAVSRKAPVVSKDLRGVQCPLNFAKTKVELSKLNTGDILEIWLDDGKPVENVPGSVQGEGHKIISQQRQGEYWKVVIEKK